MYEQKANAGKLIFKNNFYLQRGAYDLVAVLDESVSNEPYIIKGNFIDLFDPKLPVYQSKTVNTGEQAFLLNIDRWQINNVLRCLPLHAVYMKKR
jgi:hypothetical protein